MLEQARLEPQRCLLARLALAAPGEGGDPDGVEPEGGALPLLLELVEVAHLGVPVTVLLVADGQVVHGVVPIQPTAPHALRHPLRIEVMLSLQHLHDSLLQDQALGLEVDEVRPRWLVGQREIASAHLPEPNSEAGLDEDGGEQPLSLAAHYRQTTVV